MFYFPGAAHTQFRLKDETIKQGLSQLSGLRRKFVPSRPLEGDKWEHYSKCNINNKMFFSTN